MAFTKSNVDQFINFRAMLVPAFVILLTTVAAKFGLVSFHTASMRLAVMIAIIMFAFVWATRKYRHNDFLFFLVCGYFWVGILNLTHVFVSERIGFITEANENISLQLWISARYIEALMFLLAPFVAAKRQNDYLLLIAFGIVAISLATLIFSGHFPTALVEGYRLSNFSVYSNYLIILILAPALYFLIRHSSNISKDEKTFVSLSVALTLCAEILFATTENTDSFSSLAGHLLKLLSYWFIFQAVVQFNFGKPFSELRSLQIYNRSLFEDSVTGMALCRMDGTFADVNPAFAKLTGYSVEELLKLDYWHITPEKYSRLEEDLLKTANTTGKYGPVAKEYVRKDGSLISVELTGIIISHNGEPHMWSSVEDITDRQKLQNTANELEFQKQTLDEHAIVSIADANRNIIYVNDKFCAVSGYSRDELLGQSQTMLHAGEQTPEFYDELWRTISSGNVWQGEMENIKKDRSYYWVDATVVPFRNDKGDVTKYVTVCTDVTKRNDAENAIRHFKTTLDLTVDEVYMFWPDTLKFFYVNQAAADQAGKSVESFNGKTPAFINPIFDESEFCKKSKCLVFGTQTSITYESIHLNALGKQIPVEVLLQIIDPDEAGARFVAISRDISDRKAVDKAKSEFISTVSHELRTPLTSIKGALGLIDAGVFGKLPEKVQSLVSIAHANSNRLALLVDDILDLEKAGARMTTYNKCPTSLNVLIEESAIANESFADKYGVTLVVAPDSPAIVVNVDRDRIMQVMTNLLSNAVKFSHRGGTVNVSASRHNGYIRIAIEDYGRGIPEDAQATIFDRFTQADSSDQRKIGGTGLGLSIAKSIVEAHGGSIGFITDIDKGTTFYVDLKEVAENDTKDKGDMDL